MPNTEPHTPLDNAATRPPLLWPEKNLNLWQRLRQKHAPLALFAREILTNPRNMGAACPSSARLARVMAAQVPLHDSGLVLELGAGTGVVTQALLQRGIAPERLVSIEISTSLAQHLHSRFPAIRVIHGDAGQLHKLIGEDYAHITTIVSSLPLRSLPLPVVEAISRQLQPLLQQGAALVQFTYDLRKRPLTYLHLHAMPELRRTNSQIVWRNLPPARVDVFRLHS
jgi:phosphatidylethanolamine/phosphatidyl-N-methylethanolamine N-methyltransferase